MKATSSLAAIVIVVALVAVIGCGGGGSGGGESPAAPDSVTVSIHAVLGPGPAVAEMSPASVAEIDRITVTVSGPGFDDITTELSWDLQTRTATGSVEVPVGDGRVFMVEAIRADGLVLYRGEQTADVVGNVRVSITLVPPDVPFDMVCPIHEFDGPARIEIESVPEYGEAGYAEGSVANVVPWECAVAVYIRVGSSWWTKPYWNNPLTMLDTEGQWTCDITTGGIDTQATEIRAYLVRAGYSPPPAPSEGLPPDPPTPDVLAMDSVTRTPPEE